MTPLGKFVVFEGGDGSGKSTQLERLTARLRDLGRAPVTVREPGGTPFGETMRAALLEGGPASSRAELLAFNAARAELVASVIRPALEAGRTVLADRFTGSTVAYQGYGRGLDLARVHAVNEVATGGLAPDLVLLLDLAPGAARARLEAAPDRIEGEHADFHERVREGYLALAHAEPERWRVLDATLPVDALAAEAWSLASFLFER